MITRAITQHVLKLATQYPVVSLSGPRQSGKTTLVRQIFPHLEYVNFEDIELRILAQQDPKQFLNRYQKGLIIDEAQYVPSLFSYIQLEADSRRRNGEFILTGSQNFLLMEQITQSLAGRVALFNLLPFSISELKNTDFERFSFDEYLLNGFYPRLYQAGIDPAFYYPNYIQSYIERDIRQLVNVSD
ncbi:MAG: AAA family ATPase, partial [Saprospiraceae bacterium]|nr:AAA family ATPase [Saprospiraceae bacterium]